jgi:hypothetical protein
MSMKVRLVCERMPAGRSLRIEGRGKSGGAASRFFFEMKFSN